MDEKEIPAELVSTVRMVRDAFPRALSEADHPAVIWLLAPHMSHRQLARALAFVGPFDDIDSLHHIDRVLSIDRPSEAIVDRVRDRLRAVGLDEWIAEGDGL